MRPWTPQTPDEAKPCAFIGLGVILAGGAMLCRELLCPAGAALAIVGGATLQWRQDALF